MRQQALIRQIVHIQKPNWQLSMAFPRLSAVRKTNSFSLCAVLSNMRRLMAVRTLLIRHTFAVDILRLDPAEVEEQISLEPWPEEQPDGVSVEEFYAYMPMHQYIFWPAAIFGQQRAETFGYRKWKWSRTGRRSRSMPRHGSVAIILSSK
jgi:hypothetical protein